MSRDDETGWSGADKTPLVVMQQRQEPNVAAAATRTAGSLILILFMLGAVVLAVLSVTMHQIYKASHIAEVAKSPHARRVVEYRRALELARQANPICLPPADVDPPAANNLEATCPPENQLPERPGYLPKLPNPQPRHLQATLDGLRRDNAILRYDNRVRMAAAAARNRPPPEPNQRRRQYPGGGR